MGQSTNKDFLGPHAEFIRELPCVICWAPGPSDPHHVETRGAGGDASDMVPMCRQHHNEFHANGRSSFQYKYKIDLLKIARYLWNWRQDHGKSEA